MAEKKEILKIKKLSKDVELPEYVNSEVGIDLRANENISIEPYEQKIIKTGIAMEIPKNHVGLIRDRAGIVKKMGIHTSAGTFDPNYRGEISVILVNFGDEAVLIEKGMRIAQLVILPVTKVSIKQVEKLEDSERGEKGFGSTGIKDILNKDDLEEITGKRMKLKKK
ncbi:MAG: dUTP diphosphatase [archaeon]|nr:dUTP diphosphatase [archaeon]